MNITAVICEYNPFHKGHKQQLDTIKQQNNLVVCIMSGGFVQRGIPAIFDKYDRAKAAVMSGADLVLELPYPYSCSAAEFFAFGGVGIADSLNIIDELCFGCECGDINKLNRISEKLMSKEFLLAMKNARTDKNNKDKPFAALRENIYNELYGENIPVKPNDILGVEYISALKKLNSNIVPVTYKREIGYSATESRRLLNEKNSFNMIPENVVNLFEFSDRYCLDFAEKAIISYYRTANAQYLKNFEGMTNGIADKLIKCSKESVDLAELMKKMSGKSYTNAKIRRCILNGMTGVTTAMLKERPMFTQVLACNQEGRKLIRRIQKEGNIAVLTKPAHYKKLEGAARKQAEFNIFSDNLLTLMCEKTKSSDVFLKKIPYIAE